MLSGVLRRRAAAEWAIPWGGRFLRELSFFVEGSAPSGRRASSDSAATSFVTRNLAAALSTPGVGSSVNHIHVLAIARPLESKFQALVSGRWGPAVGRPAVRRSPFLGVESPSRGTPLGMFLEAPSCGLSPLGVLESIRTVATKSTRALSSRPPLPPSSSVGASHDGFQKSLRSASSRYLSSSILTSPSPFSSQPLCTARAQGWKVAGARTHYTRFLGDDGDQLVDPPEEVDLVPTAHKGPPVPLHSYPNAMMPFLATPPPLDAVVKIFTVTSSPNYFLPWQNKPQREVSGSGFVISGRRILTNAHVVANQTFVLVRKHGTSTKYRAEVEAVGHECDLAVLKVPSDDFWEGMHPLEFGEIPQLQEQVAVVGYPQGGDNISVTAGVVSRVELTQYAHGAGLLLAVQIDAAINPGNSGGPAVMDFGSGGMNSNWKVVGVAFQNLREADSIGYIIPVPVIQHFLEDVQETGHYVGFCGLGLSCQQLENGQLRDHLGMRPGMTGVLVNRVQSLTDSHNHIRKDDVLMAFDGVPIANDGTVSFRKRERISFDHLVAMKKAGETAVVKVLRDGKELDLEVEVNPVKALVPIHQYDKLPSYFIFAGLVFVPLTQPYLHEYGDDWYNTSPRRLCERAMRSLPTQEGEQMVILSQVLIDDINSGYQTLADLQVKKVNGIDVRNLRHLRRLVEGCKEKHVRFDLDDERVMVLNFDEAKRASEGILSRHRIPSHISEDLMEDRFGDSGDAGDSTWPDRVTEQRAIPVGNRTHSKL